MQQANIPAKFPIPFANAAGSSYIRPIPQASQIGVTPGAASLTDGFPPLNFIPTSAGGVAPSGADFNGIFNQITAWIQYISAGGPISYDATFQAAIGGYPFGAQVWSVATPGVLYRSIVDNNLTNPDAKGAGWALSSRIKLDGPRTISISGTGNDATGSLTSPFLTAQGAYAWALYNLDLNEQNITLSFGAGNFGPLSMSGLLPGQRIRNQLIIQGTTSGTTTIGNVTPSAVSAAIQADSGAQCVIHNVTVVNANSAGSSLGIVASHYGSVSVRDVTFGVCADKQLVASNGGQVFVDGAGANLVITGGGSIFCYADSTAYISLANANVTITSPVTYTSTFIAATWQSGIDAYNINFTGPENVAGNRYIVNYQSNINTNGSGASYFPGTVAGVTDASTYGVYI